MHVPQGNRQYFTIGQTAEMNKISRKTLRLYQEKELLIPAYVDNETGYRYYTLEQFAQLDMIQKLQSIGLSLQDIGSIIKAQNIKALELMMHQQAQKLEEQINMLNAARDAALMLADSCSIACHKPPCNVMNVEWMPQKRLLYFDVEPYSYEDFQDVQQDGFYQWEMALRSIKRQFIDLGIPLSLFHNVGCFATQETLEKGKFIISGAGVHVSPDFSCSGCRYRILPAGLYLTAYCDSSKDTPSFCAESDLVMKMLNTIRDKGWKLAGDYYGDVLADTPAFHYTGRENFMRIQIPVILPQT